MAERGLRERAEDERGRAEADADADMGSQRRKRRIRPADEQKSVILGGEERRGRPSTTSATAASSEDRDEGTLTRDPHSFSRNFIQKRCLHAEIFPKISDFSSY